METCQGFSPSASSRLRSKTPVPCKPLQSALPDRYHLISNMREHDLPIKVGQMTEVMSYMRGYRGAWFRCKVQKITSRHGETHVGLEYPDYPDEKILWTKLYQWAPSVGGVKRKKRKQLMVRPCYPPIYRKSEKPKVDNNLELAIIVEDEWKVGDLVDWSANDCFWSGRVTKMLDDEKIQIELPPPPEGEGSTYEVCSMDLRPSLNWSPESGWTLPTLMGGETSRHRLIKPASEGEDLENITADRCSNASFSSETQPRSSSPREQIAEMVEEGPLSTGSYKRALEPSDAEVQKTRSSDTVLVSDAHKGSERDDAASLEGTIRLNSTFSDSLEDAVMDLERLASHVRMLQDMLKVGMLSKTAQVPKIPESHAPSIPKSAHKKKMVTQVHNLGVGQMRS